MEQLADHSLTVQTAVCLLALVLREGGRTVILPEEIELTEHFPAYSIDIGPEGVEVCALDRASLRDLLRPNSQ